jgi:competence protein ComEC
LIDTGKKGTLLKSLSQKMPVFDKKIEEVYLTHPDSDHIGAFEELSNNYQIEKVYFSWKNSDTENAKKVEEIIKLKTIPAETSYLGDVNYLGLLKLDTLWPKENLNLSSNDSSIVLKAEIEGSKALLTGDLEIKGQNLLLNTGQDLAADLIKIPHHGSAGAFDEGFMAKVGAKNAVISVGSNSYGHPSDVVLEGLKKFSISIFRTDELGTIDFISTSNRFIKR